MLTVSPEASTAVRPIAVTLGEWSRLEAGTSGPGVALLNAKLANDSVLRREIAKLARHGVLSVTELRNGLSLETTSFVGRVIVGPLDVTIVPKVGWSRWQSLFGFALRLRDVMPTEFASARSAEGSLQDLLVNALVTEARDLIARGLHREYVSHRKSLSSPRGRIDFGMVARAGGVVSAEIPCRFSRRSDDSLVNRVLLAGLLAGRTIARDVRVRSEAHRLSEILETSVTLHRLDRRLVAQARDSLDRRTIRYAAALRVIELLVEGMSLAIEGEEDEQLRVRGFALDMNSLWQRTLARVLAEWTDGLQIREEYGLTTVITRDPGFDPRKGRTQRPRPDFAVFRGAELVALLDAKYRDLWARGLPRDMLYQVSLYAAGHGAGVAAMLYPTDTSAAQEERFRIHDVVTGAQKGTVALRPVSLARLEKLVSAAPSVSREHDRELFARSLI